MPRPKCCRKVGLLPDSTFYQPEGNDPLREEVILTLDEFEAIRLADYAKLYQEQAAERMNISRQTFGRIVDSAHKKIAEMLINGKALRIEGGEVSVRGSKKAVCGICRKAAICVGKSQKGICPHCIKSRETIK
jgi:predicted DNA-binding protein (UPF0251 family)